ncbi:hypothetical protein PanWU01x14_075310 [Parasponia andersonii]|uniref:Uncharacterized protein n=1 Tax=Parasponia andersonii TaxID=3476 RepID=A0A2P5DCS0_PARAD|nr:hypothetical protein PanWU01x14_075310 [Parasponia andersonii]
MRLGLAARLVRHEELVAKLAEAEAGRLAQSKGAKLAQDELRVKEQDLQNEGAEMGLVFITRDRAIDDAQEARKAEAKAKLKAHSLQRRLDRSNEVNRHFCLDHKKLMRAHAELSRKHSKDLTDINTHLVDLSQQKVDPRLAALRDRLADTEKLKTRYQR